MKAVFVTLGCKINQSESEGMGKILQDAGYEVSYETHEADLVIVNTCSVTAEADRKSRQAVHRLAKLNPFSRILVTGCSAQKDSQVFSELPNVVTVGGTYDKYGWLKDYLRDSLSHDYFTFGKDYVDDPVQLRHRTREYIKVQDGCDRFCAYCIIPYLRGRSRSRSIKSITEQVERSTAREIVLTGIDLSDYGKGKESTLVELLKAVRHPRIRLGSLEPQIVTRDLLEAMKDDCFCKHFHLSLQSGSDGVLRAMNRKYTAEEFLEKIALIRSFFPNANITTDYIAGFPTETDDQHKESLEMIERAKFGAMHVFPYSSRSGTRAAKLPQVPKAIRHERAKEIAAAADRMRDEYRRNALGSIVTVLTETSSNASVNGYSETYLPVELPIGTPLNELIQVKLVKLTPSGILGERIES